MNDRNGQATPFWDSISDADRDELRRIGLRRFSTAGMVLVRQDEFSHHVLVILAGCVKVVHTTSDGRHTVLALRNAGDLVGELSAIDHRPRSATLHALTDVEYLAVTGARFEAFRRIRPGIDRVLSRQLSARLRESDRLRAGAGTGFALHRLATLLLELAQGYGTSGEDGIRIALPLSQDDLAGLTGTSRRTVDRLLGEWRRAGWITTARRSLLVHDAAAIANLRAP